MKDYFEKRLKQLFDAKNSFQIRTTTIPYLFSHNLKKGFVEASKPSVNADIRPLRRFAAAPAHQGRLDVEA
jgi:hypothetical protein